MTIEDNLFHPIHEDTPSTKTPPPETGATPSRSSTTSRRCMINEMPREKRVFARAPRTVTAVARCTLVVVAASLLIACDSGTLTWGPPGGDGGGGTLPDTSPTQPDTGAPPRPPDSGGGVEDAGGTDPPEDAGAGDSSPTEDAGSDEPEPYPGCGALADICCMDVPQCEGGLMCADDGTGSRCRRGCTFATCAYGPQTGFCLSIPEVDFGGCFIDTAAASDCGEGNCATEYGVSTGTACIFAGSARYCLEMCAPAPNGCGDGLRCVLMSGASGAGVCLPL